MRVPILAALVIVMSHTPNEIIAEAPKPADYNAMLEFVQGFVKITPGKGKFPKVGEDAGQLSVEFSIHKYEMTQEFYALVLGNNPSRWKGPRNSIEMMTWNDANTFCKKLTKRLRELKLIKNDEVIALPTEDEWEYCCKAGTKTKYSFGDSATKESDAGKKASVLDAYAWHTGNAAGNDPPVGALKPNPWGLYDMHGYLWELTSNDWSENKTTDETKCVMRGGSWKDRYDDLTSTSRKAFPKTGKDDAVGFRCVLRTERESKAAK